MFDQIHGIAVGDVVSQHWTILKTTDGGGTWFHVPSEPTQVGSGTVGRNFGTWDTSRVWFFDNVGRQFSSTNGGYTWTYSNDSLLTVPLICWNRENLALYVMSNQVFRYTGVWVNAGSTPDPFVPPVSLVGAIGTNQFWLAQSRVYYTSDAASSWTSAAPGGLNKSVSAIDMVTLGPEVSAWAVGNGDTMHHYHDIITNVPQTPQAVPLDFSLDQNYPNPFNPTTLINYDLPGDAQVTLKLYDVLGREVRTLVDAFVRAGYHQVSLNASDLASGFYLYRLKAGSYASVKRLVVLK
jgi:hypothetical protein